MGIVSIEEVALRHELVLARTSSPGQYKAHCPICGDEKRKYHLYVNVDKGVYCCQKCGERGGVIQFHAWLRNISFEAAKAELYPETEHSAQRTRPIHPAETLTKEQLKKLGFTLRTPQRVAPKGVDAMFWARRRKAELDWMWAEWRQFEKNRQEIDESILRQFI